MHMAVVVRRARPIQIRREQNVVDQRPMDRAMRVIAVSVYARRCSSRAVFAPIGHNKAVLVHHTQEQAPSGIGAGCAVWGHPCGYVQCAWVGRIVDNMLLGVASVGIEVSHDHHIRMLLLDTANGIHDRHSMLPVAAVRHIHPNYDIRALYCWAGDTRARHLNRFFSEGGVGHLEALGNALGEVTSTTNRPGGRGNE